jgi:hypothetical protein
MRCQVLDILLFAAPEAGEIVGKSFAHYEIKIAISLFLVYTLALIAQTGPVPRPS